MKLTRKQRNALLTWAAEGIELWEINERAAKCDPPDAFEVDYLQLKHVRKKSAKKYSALVEEFEVEAMKEGLTRRGVRLREKMERHSLLKRIISERGDADYMQDVAGGKTGLLVREYKGHSELPFYKVDAALLKEMRDLEREIAIELGQWTEKKELANPDGSALLDPLVAALEKAYGDGKEQPVKTD